MQSAPITAKLVTSQYVVQLVPYVKGQVRQLYAQANQSMKKGDLLLEIDPTPYQYTVDQLEAQLKVSKANIDQAKAAEMNAQAAKAKAADQLAKELGRGHGQPCARIGRHLSRARRRMANQGR
jgi:membrane fusion protein, multidrug efflux system